MGGGRLVALPLAWLAGVAVHLQERSLLPLENYATITACALLALLAAAMLRKRRFVTLLAIAGACGRTRCRACCASRAAAAARS